MPTTTTTTTTLPSGARSRRRWPLAGRWAATALAFPPSGLLAIELAGPVDRPASALLGGLLVGAGTSGAQWAALRTEASTRRDGLWWVALSATAMAIGLVAGAATVGYGTRTADLVAMGAVTGALLGPVQGELLRRSGRTSATGALAWASSVPALWSLGWFVTAAAGVDVERQYAIFGLTGALTACLLGGLVLQSLPRPTPS